ncbi:MAG: type 1 glutamine amidotransferase [Alphaproteobacteria bacterium]|nr:type 1 glutamine amidotransferase [Alphaproteobacteria bacterium]
MATSPRFLVIDGYGKESRDELAAGGCSVAGELYARMVRRHAPNAAVDILYPSDPGAALPKGVGLDEYDGACWTGCNLTAYDDKDARVRRQIELAREIFHVGTPSFGSCWAAQVAVVAAGGIVRASPKGREMGIARKVRLTPEGRAHPMYVGKPGVFDAFISHVDEITHLPPGALALASNGFSAVQAVCVNHGNGTFWAPQYHPEYDLHEMARLTYCRIAKLMQLGFFRTEEQAREHVARLEALHEDPTRFDLAWSLGIDEDVMNPKLREVEVANWVAHQVMPRLRS